MMLRRRLGCQFAILTLLLATADVRASSKPSDAELAAITARGARKTQRRRQQVIPFFPPGGYGAREPRQGSALRSAQVQEFRDRDMPVSLAAGTVRTPEFAVKHEAYFIMIQAEKRLPYVDMKCMMGLTAGPLETSECHVVGPNGECVDAPAENYAKLGGVKCLRGVGPLKESLGLLLVKYDIRIGRTKVHFKVRKNQVARAPVIEVSCGH
jgi:hypothetical protein